MYPIAILPHQRGPQATWAQTPNNTSSQLAHLAHEILVLVSPALLRVIIFASLRYMPRIMVPLLSDVEQPAARIRVQEQVGKILIMHQISFQACFSTPSVSSRQKATVRKHCVIERAQVLQCSDDVLKHRPVACNPLTHVQQHWYCMPPLCSFAPHIWIIRRVVRT